MLWSEKYRPKTFDEIKSQDNIIIILNEIMKSSGECNFIFYGKPGCGKTTTAIAIARKYYGEDYKNMILELNASDNRGVNIVRDIISKFIKTKLLFVKKKKIIILDEADSMTFDAQRLLIKLMEDYSNNVIFCFICNYINKISIPILSRCLRFRFNMISEDDMKNTIKYICEKENEEYNKKIVKDIIYLCNGDVRKLINMYQNIIKKKNKLNVFELLHYPNKKNIDNIFNILLSNEEILIKYEKINEIMNKNNLLLKDVINEITNKLNPKLFDDKKYLYILEKMGDLEYNLVNDHNIKIQLYNLICLF
jgi:replication factor C subunit 3/5